MTEPGPRVTFLAEIPTPYILPTLEELSERVDLTVLFGSWRGSRGQEWSFATPAFRHRVVNGMTARRKRARGTDIYLDPRLFGLIAKARPQVIVTPAFSFPTIYAALYGALKQSRFLIYSVGTSLTESEIGRAQLLARRILINRSAGCVGLSSEAMRRFRELGCDGSRVFYAPHATRLEDLLAAGTARLPSPDGHLRVLVVSRLIPRKGVDRAIKAVAAARQSRPLMTLDVVGTGPEEQHLRSLADALAPGAIRFHGFVDQAGLPERYAAADALIFPSLRDQFGVVALEAAASSLPIVASPHAGATTDLITDGESGLVADPNDIDAVADALMRLADSRELRHRLGNAARERSCRHQPSAAAAGYVAAIEHALAR
jgi:glycosyltransferase involved in cell wall biosynthesis